MKIALVGYGIEGQASYRYFKGKYPEADLVIYDEASDVSYEVPEGVELINGEDVLKDTIDADVVVRTAGIPPRRIKTSGRVTSSTQEFFDACPAPIVGVTGSKGKGTTASLIHEILKADGKTSWLVGNIGTPPLDILSQVSKGDVVVFELSSFQLWDMKRSPHVAVVLMIEPDHLEVHDGMEDYVDAKANIRRYQGENDICFYYPDNKYSLRIAFADGAKGQAIRYGTPDEAGVYVESNTFSVQGQQICDIDNLQLPGDHNLGNACAAISAARVFGVSNDAVAKGLSAFTGLPHRLKFVREVGGIRYYDDSIATTPGSAIAALRAFPEKKVIILGGSEKGASYEELVSECSRQGATVVAIGTTGQTIAELCRAENVKVKELGKAGMMEIVRAATELAGEGSVVILSPASASFDMFKNYADRGEQFIAAVEAL